MVAIPVLYRSALSSLSAARAVSLDQNLIAYLESLCTRAYFCVYGTRTGMVERLVRFFVKDWPDAVRALWRETLVSGGFGIAGTIIAYVLVKSGAQWFYARSCPADMVARPRSFSASTKELRERAASMPSSGADGSRRCSRQFPLHPQRPIAVLLVRAAWARAAAASTVASGFSITG